MEENKPLSERESLALITQMITKAKDSYHDNSGSEEGSFNR